MVGTPNRVNVIIFPRFTPFLKIKTVNERNISKYSMEPVLLHFKAIKVAIKKVTGMMLSIRVSKENP